ncbi:MAG: hypothetical protein ACKV2T_39705 [Kofleriaceae bacterium]
MATFHVYVEGAVDASPDGVRKLAQAISKRYGLPVADLLTRLTAGRFRVKAGVDEVTAEAYKRALEEVGARVAIEESDGRTSNPSIPPVNLRGSTQPPPRAQATTPPQGQPTTTAPPPSRTTTPALGATQRSGASSLPPSNRASTPPHGTRSGATSLPPTTAPAAARASPLQSGLAAAYSGGRAQSESGFDALGGGALSLASVDGADDAPAADPGGAFVPPPEPMAASRAPEVAKAAAPKSKAQPLDLFAPPDAGEAEAKVELASDEIEHRAKRMSTPPAGTPHAGDQPIASGPNTPAMRRSSPSIVVPSRAPSSAVSEMPRGRFAVGVMLAIVIGFVPAHLVAASRESSAYSKIDSQIIATQNAVEDEDQYRALDGFRAAQLGKKKSARTTIAWQSMLIWAAVGAAVAFVYFRQIRWKSA